MANRQLITRAIKKRPVIRRPYLPPALREFGLVGALTQGGTAGPIENMQMCGQGSPNQMC